MRYRPASRSVIVNQDDFFDLVIVGAQPRLVKTAERLVEHARFPSLPAGRGHLLLRVLYQRSFT
jgi:hypothetical protein